jgi:hypothetical protein
MILFKLKFEKTHRKRQQNKSITQLDSECKQKATRIIPRKWLVEKIENASKCV